MENLVELLLRNGTDLSTYILIYLIFQIRSFNNSLTDLKNDFYNHLEKYHKDFL